MKPRSLVAAGAVAGAAIFVYSRRSCPLEQRWSGPVPHYDYLRTIAFERGPGERVSTVPVDNYPEPTPRRFGCRVTFARDPFPASCGEGREFYACPLD